MTTPERFILNTGRAGSTLPSRTVSENRGTLSLSEFLGGVDNLDRFHTDPVMGQGQAAARSVRPDVDAADCGGLSRVRPPRRRPAPACQLLGAADPPRTGAWPHRRVLRTARGQGPGETRRGADRRLARPAPSQSVAQGAGAGATVFGNRDPTQFAHPAEVNFERANLAKHIAFGSGVHNCIGKHLARRELRIALDRRWTTCRRSPSARARRSLTAGRCSA